MNSVPDLSVDSLPQGPPSDEHSDEADIDLELMEKFSRLTFLLAGVTAVNNDNHHPTLRTIEPFSIDERVRYMKSKKSTHTVLMEAVTALLVQDSEVLASMARNTTSVITFHAPPTEKIEMDLAHKTNQCVPVPIGKSYWDDIEKAGSGFVFPESGSISFPDHVATVNAYLNWFKEQSSYKPSIGYPRFSEYIVSACWQKMEQRIGHWATVGLLYRLSNIPEQFLRMQVKFDSESPVQSDPKLVTYLKKLTKTKQLERIVSFFDFEREGVNKEKNNTLPALQQCLAGDSTVLYTQETFVEFHRLAVAAMLCYAQSLQTMRLLYDNKHPPKKTMLKRGGNQMSQLQQACKMETVPEKTWLVPSEQEMGKGKGVSGLVKKMSGLFGRLTKTTPEDKDPKDKDPKDEDPETLEAAARHVFITSHFLSAILNSAAFKRHIESLVKHYLLVIPVNSEQKDYHAFADRYSIPFRITRGNQTPALLAAKGKVSQEGSDPSLALQQVANEEVSQEVQEHDGLQGNNNDDDDPEQDQGFENFSQNHLPIAIEGWMKLLVQHLLAQRDLEKYCVTLATGQRECGKDIKSAVNIEVYGIKPPPQPLLPKWDILRKLIKATFEKEKIAYVDSDILIDRFEAHFKGDFNSKATKEDPSSCLNRIFFSFMRLIRGEDVRRFFGIHCEAALTTAHIAKLFEGPYNDDAEGLQWSINPETVSVSKLCCPACWTLLDILGSSNEIPGNYEIRGFHSTVFPVVLPPWIKRDIVEKLVQVFERHLVQEFLRLRKPVVIHHDRDLK